MSAAGQGSSTPLISIITMNYNYAAFLPETIESIIGQSHENIQYIVADDGSVDDSVAVVERYRAKDDRIELVALPKNVGACAAYAAAYRHVRGDFVCSIDADDVAMPGKFAKQLAMFAADPSLDLATTYVEAIDAEGIRLPQPNRSEAWVNQVRDLSDCSVWASQNYVAHSAVMMRRAAHDAVGVLDADMVYAPDYDHFVRFVAKGFRFGILPEPLLKYRIHGNNNTFKAPHKTFIEMAYSFWCHLLPRLIEESRFNEIAQRFEELASSEHYAYLSADERARLLAVLASDPSDVACFADFQRRFGAADPFAGLVVDSILMYGHESTQLRAMMGQLARTEEQVRWLREDRRGRRATASSSRPNVVPADIPVDVPGDVPESPSPARRRSRWIDRWLSPS